MMYLIFNFSSMFFLYLRDRWKVGWIGYIFFFILISILPGFQYGVGTDYFSYENIYNNASVLEYYFNTKEYAFYYLVKCIHLFSDDSKFFFGIVAILQSLLITFIFIKFKAHNFVVFLLFFCFFSITNLMHTQMNIIRVSFSIYLFILSLLYKFEGRILVSLFFLFLGVLFHKSTLAMLPFFIIPVRIYGFIYGKPAFFFLMFLSVFLFNPLGQFTLPIIEMFFLSYSNYYVGGGDLIPVSTLNILTKAYYIPISAMFIYYIGREEIISSEFERRLVGFWIIISSSYLLSYHYSFFTRINFFFVFYYIIPIYYVMQILYSKKKKIKLLFLTGYIFIPYILKVIFFPLAEFNYKTYIF